MSKGKKLLPDRYAVLETREHKRGERHEIDVFIHLYGSKGPKKKGVKTQVVRGNRRGYCRTSRAITENLRARDPRSEP